MTKVLLSVEDRLLRRLDAAAERNGLSRSACVAWLLELRLGHETGPGADPAVRAAMAEIDHFCRPVSPV